MLVYTARSSNALMCSPELFHFQPVIGLHLQSLLGTLARSRWYRSGGSLSPCTNKSSPFSEVKPKSLRGNALDRGKVEVLWIREGRRRMPWKLGDLPGVNLSNSCVKESGCTMPSLQSNTWSNHATTGTDQEFPSNVNLQSWCCGLSCHCLLIHCLVYWAGKPSMTSLSKTLGGRASPDPWWRQWISLSW